MTLTLNLIILLFSVINVSLSQVNDWKPVELGRTTLRHPAFVNLIPSSQATNVLDNHTLYISCFDSAALFQTDDIFYMKSPGRYLSNVSNWQLTLIDQTHYWPNDMFAMPEEAVGTEGIIWTSGFLAPTKNEGHLSLYLTNTEPLDGPYNIASLDDNDYSYHRVIWHDVNHDGYLDVITARFRVLDIGQDKQLLWLENPKLNTPTEGWTQHLIVNGSTDVNFVLTTLFVNSQPFVVFMSAEFWNKRITLYYAEDGSDIFLYDPSKLIERVIDDTSGQSFDLDIVDLNRDGKPEIILSAYDGTEGFVYNFMIPDDFRNGTFIRNTLARGFYPNSQGEGWMAPGTCKELYKGADHENSGLKPYVMLSGDDDGNFYILTPNSEDVNDWTYTKNYFLDTNATIAGEFSIADLDGDSWNEIVMTGYSADAIYVYSYAP